MPPSRITEEQWARAREAWERGVPNRVAGEAAGISGEAVRKKAAREGWERRDADVEAQAEARRRQTEAASLEQRRKWANRRSEEADSAGVTAAVARQAIVSALQGGDEKMVRAAAIAYGILIDKAQLLSGAATGRFEVGDPKERALSVFDELEQRRRAAEQKRTG